MANFNIDITDRYSLRALVFNDLRQKILIGEYCEGRLLQEIKISEEFGVSRTPVREALKQLELEGLVTMIPNKGAKVVSISDRDIEDIYDIRCLVEGLAARWAAEKITDSQLENMKNVVELAEFYTEKNNIEKLANEDSKFHKALYEACDSKYLQHILIDFHQYCQRARIESLSVNGRAKVALKEHIAIFQALKERNPQKAEILANEHVKNAKQNLITAKSSKI